MPRLRSRLNSLATVTWEKMMTRGFCPTLSPMTSRWQRPWPEFAPADGHPRDTLVAALDLCAAESQPPAPTSRVGFAVDLGCGDGCDTVALLRHQWQVLAIDGKPEAIAQLKQRQDINPTYLETQIQRLEDLTLPPHVDLINASFCLPFCPPEYFVHLWENIVLSLRVGGRFCGHLSGDYEPWVDDADRNGYLLPSIDQLLAPFTIELLYEEEHLGHNALGQEQYWHLYNIVACKR